MEYQGNSHKSKEAKNLSPPEEKKKQEKVIEGEVTVLKTSGIRKIASMILTGNPGEVGPYVVDEVIVPLLKKTAYDLIVNGGTAAIGMLIYGKEGGRPPTTVNNIQKVSYRAAYNENNSQKQLGSRNRVYDYDQIAFSNRGEAEAVLNSLREQLGEYGIVSVGDLYDAVGITGEFTTHKYGWKNLNNACVIRTRDYYTLKLPPAQPLD